MSNSFRMLGGLSSNAGSGIVNNNSTTSIPVDQRKRNPYLFLDLIKEILNTETMSKVQKQDKIKVIALQVYALASSWRVAPWNWWKSAEIYDARAVYPIIKTYGLTVDLLLPSY